MDVERIIARNASKNMATKKIRRIGLTGGIASGKSTVSAMLARMGAVIVDTDQIAREVVKPGSEALAAICRKFGRYVSNPDGSLRRDTLAKIVFADQQAREWLQALLHPLIRKQAEEQAGQAEQAGHQAVVFDVPLLFESGWDQYVDEIWTVYVSPQTQRYRLTKRDGLSQKEVSARLKAQWPIARKARKSDVVFNNEGDLEETQRQVNAVCSQTMQKYMAGK